jgi:HicB-like protein involved in pilus formation
MDLTPFVDNVRREMAVAAEAGGDEARALAERLTAPLVSAIRLTLLDALSAAAEEITRDLAPGSVEVRLRTGEATFAVNTPVIERPAATETVPVAPEPEDLTGDDGSMVRINLRLSENLKARIEEAAAEQGRSVNAWLVRAAATALQQPARTDPVKPTGGSRSPNRYTGWVS